MSENTELIEKYADLTDRIEFLQAALAEMLEKAVPEEVKKALEEVKAEYQPMIESAQNELAEVRKQIEEKVLADGTAYKGSRFMATWNKGRSGGWDTDMIKGFALVHPEIMAAKKPDGEPTVTFRKVK